MVPLLPADFRADEIRGLAGAGLSSRVRRRPPSSGGQHSVLRFSVPVPEFTVFWVDELAGRAEAITAISAELSITPVLAGDQDSIVPQVQWFFQRLLSSGGATQRGRARHHVTRLLHGKGTR